MKRSELAHFAALVRRYRRQGGYKTARAFYDAQGGRQALGTGYKAYANLERGASVPQPALVEKLVAAFRLALSPERSREFSLAYLRVLLGFEGMLEFATQVLAGGGGAGGSAGRRGDSGETVELSPAQAKTLEEPFAHAAACALSQDAGAWSAAELAEALRLDAKGVERALAALRRSGLTSVGADGRHAWAAKGPLPALPDKAQPEWPGEGGEVILDHPLLVRARESELRAYLPFLTQSLAAAELYRTDQRGADTGLFTIELAVSHLLAF